MHTSVMPALVAGHPDMGVRKHAVLRTAKPGHDAVMDRGEGSYITLFTRPQVFSADQMLRSSRKRSMGADDLIELMR
jgi:hypothetical protein